MVSLVSMVSIAFTSCDDDPGVENYYTSTKEYASDFLTNRSGQYSMFIEVLQRATGENTAKPMRLMDLLSTYGSYTVFAPNNEAMTNYLASMGLTSVDEMKKEDCDTLAFNHIIEHAYFTTDVSSGTYPKTNMLDRLLEITCMTGAPKEEGGDSTIIRQINHTGNICHADDSVANGVVHTLDVVIGNNNELLAEVLQKDSDLTLFNKLLQMTGIADSLRSTYVDLAYTIGSDSVDWDNDKLVMSTATEYDNVAYMKKRYFKYTVFAEKDEVYQAAGLNTIEDIVEYAKQVYDQVYPDDANVDNYTDRRNSLNRFVSYHILPFEADYYKLTCVDGPTNTSVLAKNWNRRKWDIADWYETFMPHSLMKFSFPTGAIAGLYINRRGVMNKADERGVLIQGVKVLPPSEKKLNTTAPNGLYHYINKVLVYDDQTQNDVISGERLRIDCSTLSPDFITSGARGHETKSGNSGGMYGTWDATSNHNNKQTCLGFKSGFVKNFIFDDNITHLHVRPRTLSFWSYQADELTVIGQFDISVKIPPVPEGNWELRLFTCVNFSNRGIMQFYFGKGELINGKVVGVLEPCGIPVDMRPDGTDSRVGWKGDSSLGTEDAITAFDKAFHNRGWMKGMKSYYSATSESGGTQGQLFRDASNTLRKVITQFHSDGKSDYWLRIQQKLPSNTNTLNFDAIELCPASVYNNEYFAEDRW